MYCNEASLLCSAAGCGVLKTMGSGVVGFLMLGSSGDHAMLPQRPFKRRGGPSIVGPFNPKQNNEKKTLRGETNDERIGRGIVGDCSI
jgi:hypothetical protein